MLIIAASKIEEASHLIVRALFRLCGLPLADVRGSSPFGSSKRGLTEKGTAGIKERSRQLAVLTNLQATTQSICAPQVSAK